MQTSLPEKYRLTPNGRRAEDILRSCVHCGFCNATCPTYQVLGDELDGPRGRIYLIKEMLEAQESNPVAGTHLDRCLTCRACETTCPSGVAYGELLEIGRGFLAGKQSRGWFERLQRRWLHRVVPHPARFRRWLALGRFFAWLLPRRLREQLPPRRPGLQAPASIGMPASHDAPASAVAAREPAGSVLLLDGCVQRVATPGVNAWLQQLLERHGVRVERLAAEQCCGGLDLHLGDAAAARMLIRANLGAVREPLQRVDAIVSTASGCGVTLKDYARLLDEDDDHLALARLFARKVRDAGEYLQSLNIKWGKREDITRVALHVPCTLQHGQQLGGEIAELLGAAGYELVPLRDPHLCCGSAGTYSLLQPELATALRARKLDALEEHQPDVIATANVGCQTHLAAGARLPVLHWLELLT